jgi:hypothetical protein
MDANSVPLANRTKVEHNPARFPRRDLTAESTRQDRAQAEGMVVQAIVENGVATGLYEVESESGSQYTVDVEEGRCSCPDHQNRDAKCKHIQRVALEMQYAGLVEPGDRVYDFDVNDVVHVDWSEGMGPEEDVIGVVTEVSESGGETIVTVVDHNSEEFVPGKTYDCAPEWVSPL